MKKTVFLIIAFLIAAYMFANLTRQATSTYNIGRTGDVWSFFHFTDSTGVCIEVDSTDFVGPPYMAVGDYLLAINGVPVTVENYFKFFNTSTEPGKEFIFTFRRANSSLSVLINEITVPRIIGDFVQGMEPPGEILTTVVRTRSIPGGLLAQLLILLFLKFLIIMSFISVGIWAYIKRPESAGVRALALFCFALAVNMIQINLLNDFYAAFNIPFKNTVNWIFRIFAGFFSAFWLHLQLLFPKPRKFVKRHRITTLLLCYIPILTLIVLSQIIPLLTARYLFPSVTTSQVLAGFILLAVYHFRQSEFLEKRQTRLVLWGSAPGLFVFMVFMWLNIIFPGWLFKLAMVQRFGITNFSFLLLLLIPLSFAYAFGRYRLLDVESRLKRGTAFLAVSGFLLVISVGAVFGIGKLLIDYLGIESQTPILVIGLGLAVGFMPAQKKLRTLLQDTFYPERKRLKSLMKDFLQTAPTIGNRKAFWAILEEKLEDGLGAEVTYPVLMDEEGKKLLLEGEKPVPFKLGSPLVKYLFHLNRALMVDELLAGSKIETGDEEKNWLKSRNIAVLLPLICAGRMLGFFCLGRKITGEDYEPEELNILNSLAAQIAVSGENQQLLEFNLEKRHMEEQLSFARRIQEGLLPETIPEIKGLEVAASSTFCLEIAGDYYDVLPIEDGRTVLAVGDVAGKGAGAALLMANLQASLRTAFRIGGSINSVISRINKLVYENTPLELFITLFAGVYDPSDRSFCYVNAGHNPPILIKSDEKHTTLTEGGIILGIMPDAEYKTGKIQFDEHDLLVMYTDGLSETMNKNGEEFGEHRIREHFLNKKDTDLDKLLVSIKHEADIFRQGKPINDDLTLLAARPVL